MLQMGNSQACATPLPERWPQEYNKAAMSSCTWLSWPQPLARPHATSLSQVLHAQEVTLLCQAVADTLHMGHWVSSRQAALDGSSSMPVKKPGLQLSTSQVSKSESFCRPPSASQCCPAHCQAATIQVPLECTQPTNHNRQPPDIPQLGHTAYCLSPVLGGSTLTATSR